MIRSRSERARAIGRDGTLKRSVSLNVVERLFLSSSKQPRRRFSSQRGSRRECVYGPDLAVACGAQEEWRWRV